MVDIEFSTNLGEFIQKFSEAIAAAAEAMKRMVADKVRKLENEEKNKMEESV